MRLKKKVALVTGASRGIGRGIAIGLGEEGATVYLTGRTLHEGDTHLPLSGSLVQTAEDVAAAGGRGIALPCDHRNDEEVKAVIQRIQEEQGRIDVLVNNVWGGYEHFCDGAEYWKEKGFWDAPLSRWDSMFQAGVRAHYVTSVFAVPLMLPQQEGLIVNVSFFAALEDTEGVAYGVSKAADVRMAACMAHELREYGIAAVSLFPGIVRTEAVMRVAEYFDLSNSESPQFIGRAVAALAADPQCMEKSGKWLIAAELAEEYGFTDVDGRQPVSLRHERLGIASPA